MVTAVRFFTALELTTLSYQHRRIVVSNVLSAGDCTLISWRLNLRVKTVLFFHTVYFLVFLLFFSGIWFFHGGGRPSAEIICIVEEELPPPPPHAGAGRPIKRSKSSLLYKQAPVPLVMPSQDH